MAFFLFILTSAAAFDRLHFPNDPDPSGINARAEIAGWFMWVFSCIVRPVFDTLILFTARLVRFFLQGAVIDNNAVLPWDPAVPPTTANLENRAHAGVWQWVLSSEAGKKGTSRLRVLIRYVCLLSSFH